MKLNYTFNTLFWLKKNKITNGQHPIYLRITIDGKRTELSTKKWIEPEKWSHEAQAVKGNNEEARNINQVLKLLAGEVERHQLQLSLRDQIPTPDMIKRMLLGDDKPKYKTICDAFDYHNLKMEQLVTSGNNSNGTLKRYKVTYGKVVAFMKHTYKVADKPLNEIRLAFITEFEHYLLTVDKIHSNTAHKYIGHVKKIMNMAVGLDWVASNQFNLFKCSYKNPDREVLTPTELSVLMQKEINIPRLQEVRDVFVFCCYTGYAYSDVYQFDYNAVTVGIDGEYWLSANRQKTGTKESVPLLPVPLQIIEKYRDNTYCRENDKLLPVNSNQRYNAYLKELADICGINKRLTTHIARHTFATTVTLANGVPIETVSSMLGHTSIRTTQVYAKVLQSKVSQDMNILRSKLSVVKGNSGKTG